MRFNVRAIIEYTADIEGLSEQSTPIENEKSFLTSVLSEETENLQIKDISVEEIDGGN